MEKEFNVISDPWILAMDLDGVVREYSIREIFEQSHQLRGLAGEIPTQDFAILRFLLAILHAVYGRQDDGKHLKLYPDEPEPESFEDFQDRWAYLWNLGTLNQPEIMDYLDSYYDKFWLIHPDEPFYQVKDLKIKKKYSASKLNAAINQSGNKIRLFSNRSGSQKFSLEKSEGARWLVHADNYEDCAAKKPSPKKTWTSRLGATNIKADTLFQTLLLNLVLHNGNEAWGIEKPRWAQKQKDIIPNQVVPMPDNLSELYSLPGRCIELYWSNGRIESYKVTGGKVIESEKMFALEPMTCWRKSTKKNVTTYTPKQHTPSRAQWRDLSSLLPMSKVETAPGVIKWVRDLKYEDYLDDRLITVETTGIEYGAMSSSIVTIFGDSLTFSLQILDQSTEAWRSRIIQEVSWTDQIVSQYKFLVKNIELAKGNTGDMVSSKANAASSNAFYRLDIPFREWLRSLNPQEQDIDEAMSLWRDEAVMIIKKLGEEEAKSAGPAAFTGRVIKDKKKDRIMTTSIAKNIFDNNIYKLHPKEVNYE